MISTLNELNELGWFFVALAVVLVISGIVSGVKLWKDFTASLGLKSVSELEKEQTKKDIKNLQDSLIQLKNDFESYKKDKDVQYTTYHNESIGIRNELKEDVKYIVDKLDKYVEVDNRRTVATLRTSLWRLHRDFMEQGYVTPDGLKTWNEMGKVYIEAGGNDIFHDKLQPEVSNLPIRYPEGSVYNMD